MGFDIHIGTKIFTIKLKKMKREKRDARKMQEFILALEEIGINDAHHLDIVLCAMGAEEDYTLACENIIRSYRKSRSSNDALLDNAKRLKSKLFGYRPMTSAVSRYLRHKRRILD